MPHDTMPPEFSLAGGDAEIALAPRSKEPSAILSLMKQAGRSLVKSAESAGGKAVLLAMIAAGVLFCAPQAAKAADVTITIQGTVTNGTDVSGVFGTPGANLTGDAFTLTYTFNDALGTPSTTLCSGVPCITSLTNTTSTPNTAVLTIGTGSWTFAGHPISSASSEAQRYAPGSSEQYLIVSDYYNITGTSSGSDSVAVVVKPATSTPPLSTNANWESSLIRLSELYTSTSAGTFNLSYTPTGGATQSVTGGEFSVSSITINGPLGSNSIAKGLGDPRNIPSACDCSTPNYVNPFAALDAPDGQFSNPNQGGLVASERGDPIFVGNGNMFQKVRDYATAGQNPLEFTRYYNSLGNGPGVTTYADTLGVNWRSTYDRYLRVTPPTGSATTVSAERADGQIVTFNYVSSTWVPDTDVDMTLTQAGSTWTLKDHNDTTETYTQDSTGKGTLNSIALRNGYTQNLTYSGGLLQSVTDSYSRSLTFGYTSGLLSSVTTPDSLSLSYGYTPATGGNQLTSVSYSPSSTSQSYSYTNLSFPFALTGITDENGNSYATFTYDTLGNALTSEHGSGASLVTLGYGSAGTTTVTNALGVVDTYTFVTTQNAPRLTEISRAATSTTAAATRIFAYDSNGYLNSEKDWDGNQTTFTNNSHGQPTTINYAVGSSQAYSVTIAYDPTWVHLPKTVTTPGVTLTYAYDGSGNTLSRTDTDTTTNSIPYSTNGQTRETQWTWNSTGQMLSVQLPRTDVTAKTQFGYASDGALTSITDALSNVTQITSYTSGGLPLTVKDPNGVTTTLAYDGRLNLNTSTVATGAGNLTTTWTWDPAQNLTSVEKPDSSKLTYGYDTAHRLTSITDLPGNSITYTLDALGDRTATQVENPSSTVTASSSATFDALGRMLTYVGGMSQTTTLTWDKNNNMLTLKDPLSNTTTLTYDALNRVATSADPSPGGTTTYTYDSHNRVLSVKDANSNTTSYVYDGFGDRTQTASIDSGTTVYHYDPDKNLTQKVLPGSITANYTYDANDRQLTAAYPGDTTLNVSRTYDQTTGHGFGIGHMTSATDKAGSLSLTYDERGNTTYESRVITSIGTLNTTTAFDAASNISSITYPSGTVVAYSRNSMGLVTSVTAQPPGAGSPSNVATSVTYEPFGPVTGLSFGNGITGTYAYDNDYRPTSRQDAGSSNVLKLAYTYDAADNVKTITDSVNAANGQTLGYDALNRLNSAVSGTGGYGSWSWTWDKVHNVETQVIAGTTTTFTLNSGTNQLEKWVTGSTTENVTTNAQGHISTLKIGSTTEETLAYNQANQLSSATTTSSSASYIYGLAGDRLEKTPATGYSIVYQYGQAAKQLLAENDLHSGTTADYIYLNPGNGTRPIGQVNPTSGNLYFTHTDLLGTPNSLTDSTKTVVWNALYQAFGSTGSTVTGTLTTQSLRLPGQIFDPETGYNHNGFRDYAGTLTRYVETDPIGLQGGTNTYQYVRANPFKYTDRRGEGPELLLPIVVGFGVVAVNQVEYFLYAITPPTTPASVPPPPPLPGTVNACTPNNPYGKQSMASPTGTFVYSLPSIPNRPEGPEEPPELPEIELK